MKKGQVYEATVERVDFPCKGIASTQEGPVTVKKANVKVKVNSTNIRAGQPLPANYITTDPDGKFEFYTIYAGATSNVNLGLYLDLPAKYTGSKLLKILDPVVERIAGKSFTAMLNEGVTLGALRKAVVEGDTANGTLMAGQSAGLVKEELSCSEIIREIMEQGEGLLSGRNV